MNEVDAGSAKAHLNPHPKERYELTFTIHDAPGPFDSVTAGAQYEVGNPTCIPTDAFSGGKSDSPGVTRRVPLERIAPQTYRGEVTVDLLADEDLFGLGVCHWNDMGAGINLVAHGVTFNAVIGKDDIVAQRTAPTYFWKDHYTNPPMKGYSAGGVPYSVYVTAPDRTKYFFIEILATRIVP